MSRPCAPLPPRTHPALLPLPTLFAAGRCCTVAHTRGGLCHCCHTFCTTSALPAGVCPCGTVLLPVRVTLLLLPGLPAATPTCTAPARHYTAMPPPPCIFSIGTVWTLFAPLCYLRLPAHLLCPTVRIAWGQQRARCVARPLRLYLCCCLCSPAQALWLPFRRADAGAADVPFL